MAGASAASIVRIKSWSVTFFGSALIEAIIGGRRRRLLPLATRVRGDERENQDRSAQGH